MKKNLFLFFFVGFSISFCSDIFAQTDYYWRSGATHLNWSGAGNWWNTSTSSVVTSPGFGNVKFDNSTISSTVNNLSGYATHAIYFLSGSSARTIDGNSIRFYDFGGNDPRIKNETTNTQTINVDIFGDGDATDPLLLEAHSGDFVLKKINNNGSPIWVNSDNGNTIDFTDIISGSGAIVNRYNTYSKLSAANTFTGDFYIDEGEVWIEENCSFNSSTSFDIGSSSRMGDVARRRI